MSTFKKTKFWEVMRKVTDQCKNDESVTLMSTSKKYTIFHFTSSQVERINAMAKSIMNFNKSPFTPDDKLLLTDNELHSIQFWENGETTYLPNLRGGMKLQARVEVQIMRFTQTEEGVIKYKLRINHAEIEKVNHTCPFTQQEEELLEDIENL